MKLLALAGIALIIGVALGTRSASAQVAPVPVDVVTCTTTVYDLNSDGKLGKADIMELWNRIQSSECNNSSATGDCAQYDRNGDGVVNFDDVLFVYNHFVLCVNPISTVRRPSGGR